MWLIIPFLNSTATAIDHNLLIVSISTLTVLRIVVYTFSIWIQFQGTLLVPTTTIFHRDITFLTILVYQCCISVVAKLLHIGIWLCGTDTEVEALFRLYGQCRLRFLIQRLCCSSLMMIALMISSHPHLIISFFTVVH